MKQLEIKLQERLIIVEGFNLEELNDKLKISHFYKGNEIELICKGDEFTEDIAKGLVHQSVYSGNFANYGKGFPLYKSALESFVSAIESNGCFWGKCPVERLETGRDKLYDSLDTSNESIVYHDNYHKRFNNWQEAESRTFNPSRTLIFKIS